MDSDARQASNSHKAGPAGRNRRRPLAGLPVATPCPAGRRRDPPGADSAARQAHDSHRAGPIVLDRRRPLAGLAILLCALALLALPALAERSTPKLKHWDISRAQWPKKPTAALVSQIGALQQMFKRYRNQRSTIEIRYPGGRDGRKWASEVRDWLVSLGIPIKDITLSVGAEKSDALRIAVIPKP